jgi:fatty acid desaturase
MKLACIYLLINFISKYSFGSLAFIFFYGQHTFEGAYREGNKVIDKTLANWLGSSVMILDPISNWISSRINKHFIHHENSLAPNWALDKAYKKLMSSFPELRNIVPHITVKEVFRAILHCKLWYNNDDPSKGKVHNGYISFKEAEKLNLIPSQGNSLYILFFGSKAMA